jgi:hypothetical protein
MRALFLWRERLSLEGDKGVTSRELVKVSSGQTSIRARLQSGRQVLREESGFSPCGCQGAGFSRAEERTKKLELQPLPSLTRVIVFVGVIACALCLALTFITNTHADVKPAVQLNVDHATPREVDDTVQQAIARDYASAWQALASALNNNNVAALNDNFIGFAQDKLTHRIHDQQQAGLKTRIIDRGHKVDAIFYSTDGAAIELRDTATLETEILEGNTVVHSDQAQVHFYVVMTGAEDRWKVRVLESTKAD